MNEQRMLDLAKELDDLCATGNRRRCLCTYAPMQTLCPTDVEWLTADEMERYQAIQIELVYLRADVVGHPKERIKIKRALRAAGIAYDKEAPLAVLKQIVEAHGIECTG